MGKTTTTIKTSIAQIMTFKLIGLPLFHNLLTHLTWTYISIMRTTWLYLTFNNSIRCERRVTEFKCFYSKESVMQCSCSDIYRGCWMSNLSYRFHYLSACRHGRTIFWEVFYRRRTDTSLNLHCLYQINVKRYRLGEYQTPPITATVSGK